MSAPLLSEPRPASGDSVKASALSTAMRCEWRLVRTDPAWWAAVAVLVGCVGYALHNGRARIDERARSVAEAQRDEARRRESLTGQLGRIERGEAKLPDAPFRDPRNAIYVGRGQGAAVAFLPEAPLSVAAVGLSDLYPQVLKVSAGSKDSFLFVDEIANPSHLLSGGFDLAFVAVYVYPLLLLALCYNVLSGEREQGTLALTAASSAPLTAVLGGKLLVRAGGPTAAGVAGLWGLLAVTAPAAFSREGVAMLGVLTLTIVLYGVFWVALALLVNSFRRDSAFNAVALVMAWVLLLLVLPAALNAVAQISYPAPARAEMVLAVRNAAVDAERDRDATEARYREQHPDTGGGAINDERTRRTLEVTLAADARADEVLARQEARVREQRRLSDRLAFLAPPALVHDAVAELAGNGHTRWDDYLVRVGAFHKTWQKFFVERAQRGAALRTADYALFPRFEARVAQAAFSPQSGWRVLVAVTWVAVVTVGLLHWAGRRLSRAD